MIDGLDVLQQEKLNYAHATQQADEYLTILTHLHSQVDEYQAKLHAAQGRIRKAKAIIDDIERAKGEFTSLPFVK